jgi:hypothetical protein
MKRNISDRWLRTLKPPETGRLEVYDIVRRGLILRVTPAGVFSWSVRAFTLDGRHSRIPVGNYPETNLSTARSRAKVMIGQVEGGGDPVAERRAVVKARKARAGFPTVEDRLAQWQAAKASGWSISHKASTAANCATIAKAIGKRALIETTRADWTALVAKIRSHSASMGALFYSTCTAFLNYAEVSGWLPANLLPRAGRKELAPPVASRERVLTDEELARVWQATEKVNPKPRAFIRTLILTAARRNEAAPWVNST